MMAEDVTSPAVLPHRFPRTDMHTCATTRPLSLCCLGLQLPLPRLWKSVFFSKGSFTSGELPLESSKASCFLALCRVDAVDQKLQLLHFL